MSRIGRMPIAVPKGVEVTIKSGHVSVKGPKGKLECDTPTSISIAEQDGQLVCTRPSDGREHRSLHGLTRALVANMVTGVTEGFSKELLLQGTGYRAAAEGSRLNMALGYSHPVEVAIPDGIEVETKQQSGSLFHITVRGIDKQQVGQFAADVRRLRPVEPYNSKGLRYADEVVRRKAGKSAVGGGAPGAT